jgi:ketosteroid isomerase-like protein
VKPSELYERVWELLESCSFDDYMELFTDDCVMQFEVELVGKAATRQYFEAVMARWPDIRHEVLSVIETDDSIAAEVRATASATGPIPIGDIQATPTAGPAEFLAVDLLWLRDGRIARWHAYFNQLQLFSSLGIAITAA